jgi:hypothetical protein
VVDAAGLSNPQLARLVRRRRVGLLLAAGRVIGFAFLTVAERAAAGGLSGRAPAAGAPRLAALLGMTIPLHVEYG